MVFQLFNHGVFNRKECREKSAEGPELDLILIPLVMLNLIQHLFVLSIKDPDHDVKSGQDGESPLIFGAKLKSALISQSSVLQT